MTLDKLQVLDTNEIYVGMPNDDKKQQVIRCSYRIQCKRKYFYSK